MTPSKMTPLINPLALRLHRIAILSILVPLLCGCGSSGLPIAPVTGTVLTCDGKPAAGGEIVFHPMGNKEGQPGVSGRESRAVVEEDGSFELTTLPTMSKPAMPGAVIGEHRVTFVMPPTRRQVLSAEDREGLTPEHIKELEDQLAKRPVYAPIACSNTLETPTVSVVDRDNDFSLKLAPK